MSQWLMRLAGFLLLVSAILVGWSFYSSIPSTVLAPTPTASPTPAPTPFYVGTEIDRQSIGYPAAPLRLTLWVDSDCSVECIQQWNLVRHQIKAEFVDKGLAYLSYKFWDPQDATAHNLYCAARTDLFWIALEYWETSRLESVFVDWSQWRSDLPARFAISRCISAEGTEQALAKAVESATAMGARKPLALIVNDDHIIYDFSDDLFLKHLTTLIPQE